MTRAMYDAKVQLLIDANSERYKGKTKPQIMQNALSRYTLIGQVPGNQLYQQTKERPSKLLKMTDHRHEEIERVLMIRQVGEGLEKV